MSRFFLFFNLFFIVFFIMGCKVLSKVDFSKVTDMFHHRVTISRNEKFPDRKLDSDLKEYFKEFLSDARSRGVYIKAETIKKLRRVAYVDRLSVASGKSVIAACNRFSFASTVIEDSLLKREPVQYMTIEVLRSALKVYAEDLNGEIRPEKVREILYHEFFHCLMNKGHLPPGVSGIMAPSLDRNSQRVFNRWKELVDELFSPTYINLIPDVS